ncbi:MAG TPA: M3 family metallopeptidase, partial [Mycobacterium sp.]|nr:M3 family metallopeptidase [Mycobacterium sp.]
RYAPLTTMGAVTWSEACAVVIEAFTRISAEAGAVIRQLLQSGRVDGSPRPRKRRGALTFDLGGGEALVMCTFTGRVRDVLTLGHELGHALHMSCAGHLGPLNAAIPTLLGESVALFTEALTARVYAETTADPARRHALRARAVEDQLVALFRQTALHDFEDRVHRCVWDGDTPDEVVLGQWWLDGQHALYGPAVTLLPGYQHWWSYLDNLYFSVGSRFSYAYGQLAAAALLARFFDDPSSFGQRFLSMLAAGGTEPAGELLRGLGVRMDRPDGWALAFEMLDRDVADICSTADLDLPVPASASAVTGIDPLTTEGR